MIDRFLALFLHVFCSMGAKTKKTCSGAALDKIGGRGLEHISGRNLTSYHRCIAINRYGVRHKSRILDLWILWKNLGAIIFEVGAF